MSLSIILNPHGCFVKDLQDRWYNVPNELLRCFDDDNQDCEGIVHQLTPIPDLENTHQVTIDLHIDKVIYDLSHNSFLCHTCALKRDPNEIKQVNFANAILFKLSQLDPHATGKLPHLVLERLNQNCIDFPLR